MTASATCSSGRWLAIIGCLAAYTASSHGAPLAPGATERAASSLPAPSDPDVAPLSERMNASHTSSTSNTALNPNASRDGTNAIAVDPEAALVRDRRGFLPNIWKASRCTAARYQGSCIRDKKMRKHCCEVCKCRMKSKRNDYRRERRFFFSNIPDIYTVGT